jgi:L-threonylcarbamoyladenylate synthase
VVLLTTDSLPGLHVRADQPDAAARLAACKGSPPGRPFLLLFPSREEALRYGRPATTAQGEALERAWPGPLTALLIPTGAAPAAWSGAGTGLAARVPALPRLRQLLEAVGAPLFSTSANLAGQEPAVTLEEAVRRFPDLPAVDLGEGGARLPSTLVDLTGARDRILRPGAAPWPPPTRLDRAGRGG